jgi:type IX secretion system PorP/SprF family membrane protein
MSISACFSQHTPLYSQYLFNPQSINPSFAGFNDALDVSLIHRRQWLNFEGAPVTTDVNMHTSLFNKKMNLGAEIQSDQIGVTKTNFISLVYAYRIMVAKEMHLAFGINAVAKQMKNEWTKIKSTTSNDPVYGNGDQITYTAGAGAGISFSTKKLTLGLSVPSVYQSLKTVTSSYKEFLVFGKYEQSFTDKFSITPSVLIKTYKNSPAEADINCLFTYNKKYSLGGGYRTNDAVIFLARISLNKQLDFGYAYDMTLNPLNTFSFNSHEIALRYVFAYTVNAKRTRN